MKITDMIFGPWRSIYRVKKKMLTFEIPNAKNELDIHLDEEGAKLLIQSIGDLLNSSGHVHQHLMTPAWAGNELSEEAQGENVDLLNKVTIHKWSAP